MKLLKCVTCREYIIHAKLHVRNHEVKNHEYGFAQYVPHHHKPLTKEERNEIVEKGEVRIGKQYFIGFGVDSEVTQNG